MGKEERANRAAFMYRLFIRKIGEKESRFGGLNESRLLAANN